MKTITVFVFVVAAVFAVNAIYTDQDISGWGHYAGETEGNFVVKIFTHTDNTFICMGSIIYPQWVLTTAHCLQHENITITAGSNWFYGSTRRKENSHQSRVVTSKSHYVVHPNYSPQDYNSENIGLVYIEEPFNLTISPKVSSISLPYDKHEPKSGQVFSWGERNYVWRQPRLHITNVTEVYNDDYCDMWSTRKWPYLMCSVRHSSRCYLEEGGPLVATTSRGRTLDGVVNTQIPANPESFACTNVHAHTYYTSVSYFVSWVFEEVSFFVPPDY